MFYIIYIKRLFATNRDNFFSLLMRPSGNVARTNNKAAHLSFTNLCDGNKIMTAVTRKYQKRKADHIGNGKHEQKHL